MNENVRYIGGIIIKLFLIWLLLPVAVLIILFMIAGVPKDGFVDAGQCGVGRSSCSGERVRCMNGYCKSDIAPTLPLLSDLPMTPPTKY